MEVFPGVSMDPDVRLGARDELEGSSLDQTEAHLPLRTLTRSVFSGAHPAHRTD